MADKTEQKTIVQRMVDPGWTDFIISELTPDEYVVNGGKKQPKIAGLRRMMTKYVGEILESEPFDVIHPSEENENTAACKYMIKWIAHFDLDRESPPYVRRHVAMADVNDYSLPNPKIRAYSLATVETRAEARVLRKLLMLNVLTADEYDPNSKDMPTSESRSRPDPSAATSSQIMGIKKQCLDMGISIDRFLAENLDREVGDVGKIRGDEALVLLAKLDVLFRGQKPKGKNSGGPIL